MSLWFLVVLFSRGGVCATPGVTCGRALADLFEGFAVVIAGAAILGWCINRMTEALKKLG